MFFARPAWLILLALPALLLVLHALRAGARSQPVSSVLLWKGVPRRRLRRRRLRLPPLPPPLLLALAALALLALAAADPWTGTRPPVAYAVVLDLPAQAGAGGAPADGQAREVALALLRERRASPWRLLIVAGNPPLDVRSTTPDDRAFAEALAGAPPAAGEAASLAELVRTAAWAVALRGGGGVAVVSEFAGPRDGLPPADPAADGRVTIESVALDRPPGATGPARAMRAAVATERPYVIEPRSPDGLPAELVAAVEALNAVPPTAGAPPVPVALLHDAKLPERLPERWVFVPSGDGERPDPGRATAAVALDLPQPAGAALAPLHPIVLDSAARPAGDPPAGAVPLALAAGRPVIAAVETGGSRGVWWGVAPTDTDLAARSALPLALDALARRLVAAAPPLSGPVAASESLRAPGATTLASAVLAGDARSPRRLRVPLAALALVLLVGEAWRRLAGSRDRAASPAAPAVGPEPPRVAVGGAP